MRAQHDRKADVTGSGVSDGLHVFAVFIHSQSFIFFPRWHLRCSWQLPTCHFASFACIGAMINARLWSITCSPNWDNSDVTKAKFSLSLKGCLAQSSHCRPDLQQQPMFASLHSRCYFYKQLQARNAPWLQLYDRHRPLVWAWNVAMAIMVTKDFAPC